MSRLIRIGQIVPSSNTTMETELPAIMRAREATQKERFTFHSSRMRMKNVERAELATMDADSHRCAAELSDARMDVLVYACLVAIMATGYGYHRKSVKTLRATAAEAGANAPIITSAGALVDTLRELGAKRIAILTPYVESLTQLVANYIANEGIQISSSRSLAVPNNLEVGRLDPMAALEEASKLDLANADVLVLSACVQMPSLEAIQIAQDRFGLPVVSAATCTARQIFKSLNLSPNVMGFGAALYGQTDKRTDDW